MEIAFECKYYRHLRGFALIILVYTILSPVPGFLIFLGLDFFEGGCDFGWC